MWLTEEDKTERRLTTLLSSAGQLADVVGAALVLVEVVLDIEQDIGIVLGQVLGPDDVVAGLLGAQGLGPRDLHGGLLRLAAVSRDRKGVAGLGERHVDDWGVGWGFS